MGWKRGISHSSHRSSAGWFRKVHSEQAHCGPSRPTEDGDDDCGGRGGGGAGRAGRGGRLPGDTLVVRVGMGGPSPGESTAVVSEKKIPNHYISKYLVYRTQLRNIWILECLIT